MASKQKYECFTCRDNGFPGVLIYLAGKNAEGKAIRVEEDGSAHVHKTKQQQEAAQLPEQQSHQAQQQGLGSTTIVTEPTSMKIINAKLDRIISMLETRQ